MFTFGRRYPASSRPVRPIASATMIAAPPDVGIPATRGCPPRKRRLAASSESARSRSALNMMGANAEESALRVQLRAGGRQRVFGVPQARADQLQRMATTVARAPFTRQTWRELLLFVLAALFEALGVAFIVLTMAAGTALAVTFVGLAVFAASLRGARGIGGGHRGLTRSQLDMASRNPSPSWPARDSSAGSSRRSVVPIPDTVAASTSEGSNVGFVGDELNAVSCA